MDERVLIIGVALAVLMMSMGGGKDDSEKEDPIEIVDDDDWTMWDLEPIKKKSGTRDQKWDSNSL